MEYWHVEENMLITNLAVLVFPPVSKVDSNTAAESASPEKWCFFSILGGVSSKKSAP